MSVPIAYLAVVIIWSTTPLAIVWSSETITPTLSVLLRMIIAAALGVIMLKVANIKLPWHRAARHVYAVSGLGIFISMLCSYLAANYLSSGMISLAFGLNPLISGLLSQRLLARQSFTGIRQLSLVIAVVGLTIVCSDTLSLGEQSGIGLTFISIGVFYFSLSGVLVKKISININPIATTVGALLFCTPLFGLSWLVDYYFFMDNSLSIEQWSARSLWTLMYLSVFGSIVGFIGYFYILQKLSPTTVSLTTLLTPIFAISLGAYLNNERVSDTLFVGAALVLIGLFIYQFGDKWRRLKVIT